MYIRYVDDIFIVFESLDSLNRLFIYCCSLFDDLNLLIVDNKIEEFVYSLNFNWLFMISYLGLECIGNEIIVRKNGVNKFYERICCFIFSYVLICWRRDIKLLRKKIRVIFLYFGKNNYYVYLKCVYEVFENDNRYKLGGIKGVLKNYVEWLDKVFDRVFVVLLSEYEKKYKKYNKCICFF